jgi:hypothetical protein
VWRQDELSRINATLSGAERKAALCQLLEQEAELIASIGRHKIVADKERKELQIKKFLDTVVHRDLTFTICLLIRNESVPV